MGENPSNLGIALKLGFGKCDLRNISKLLYK
jgi:hypothetical protein